MRIIHTSDWHIGHSLYNFDRSAEHASVLDNIIEIAAECQADAMLVCGDIFDVPQPTSSAQKMFAGKMMELRRRCPDMRVIVTAGNHDSAVRHEAFSEVWLAGGVEMIGTISHDYSHNIIEIPGKAFIGAIPYVNSRFLPENYFQSLLDEIATRNNTGLPVILMAHLAVIGSDATGHDCDDMLIGGVEATPLGGLGEGYDYLALGHIHRNQAIGTKARYSGSPLPMGFDENYAHSVSIVDIDVHGALPEVKNIEISTPRPLVSLPVSGPAPWVEALESLVNFPNDIPAYIRLRVTDDNSLPSDYRAIALAVCEDKECDFCCVTLDRKPVQSTADDKSTLSIDRLRTTGPLAVARMYANARGEELDEEVISLLEEAIANVENFERES